MSEQKVKIVIAIDEHGNYRAMGGSNLKENQMAALCSEFIATEEYNFHVTSFNVNVPLPEPKNV
jgi:hypothetical protein